MTAAVEKVVKERPILFSGPMVQAILEGRKSMTRRVVKPQPGSIRKSPFVPSGLVDEHGYEIKPRYYPGDRLWVRETFGWDKDGPYTGLLEYRATYVGSPEEIVWKPSIYMPRWASRITLEITGVRVERLNSITEEDAEAEGLYHSQDHISDLFGYEPGKYTNRTALGAFGRLWESINGKKYPWASNPFVWCVSFRKV